MEKDDLAYLREREAAERAAADRSACMASTAHEDLALTYAERAAGLERDAAETDARLRDLLDRIG
jgi:hypothetical protein